MKKKKIWLGFLKERWQRVTAIILAVIVGIILILGFIINQYWSPILAGKVKEVVAKSSDHLYNIDFTSAELHILRGTIVIYNITLKPDTAIYSRERTHHLAPNNLVELHVKRLTLSHIHPFKLYFKHELEIGEIVLNSPEAKLSYELNHTKDTTTNDHRTAWQKISKSLKSLHIGRIILGDVKFKYEDYSGNKLEISELKEMNLTATDLLIDSATQTDKSRLLYCRDILTELNNFKGKSASGLYAYKIKSLKLSTLKSQLTITGFDMQPIKPFSFFAKSYSDRFTIRLDSIQLNHFDFLNYHKYRTLTASSLVFKNGVFGIFSNPNPTPTDSTNKIKTFPNVLIRTLNTSLQIDTMKVHHIDVDYSEYNVKSHKTGFITFNNTNGEFRNITTNKEALAKNNIATVGLTSHFMNQGKLNVLFTFNLTDKSAAFTYKGHLGPMALPVVNRAAMPLGMVKLNSGTLKSFDFDIKGNSVRSKGRVSILYNNLQVSLLNADTSKVMLKKKVIASLFANVFMIKHDNPDKPGEPARFANVNYARPRVSPFFKTAWKTLFDGIKPCAGLDKKTQEAATARIRQNAADKVERKTKKEQRIERRTERRKKRQEKKMQKDSIKKAQKAG